MGNDNMIDKFKHDRRTTLLLMVAIPLIAMPMLGTA